jgi:site-specific DNA recombinase
MTAPRTLRCAVYTRKSTDEGLEQDFNSLQAQREACEAFIRSQRSEGWTLVPTAYDDGGISGGTMDRPALQRLMANIEEKRIDVIVVYKVDRLTRSLADFSKMVELFDRHGVSFVAVTQQFNTTTSMGRLTLNVLLSFAQFEREVTSERIRDKIAASKKKGLWMGGLPPLGYRVHNRQLVVEPGEAAYVKAVYELYLKLGTVKALVAQVRRKLGMPRSATGEREVTRGGFYTMLQNPVYVGLTRHKENRYPGQHEAIIDRALWDAVQTQLQANCRNADRSTQKRDDFPLRGKLVGPDDQPIKPYAANKKGQRYRYYVTNSEEDVNDRKAAWRLPALEVERHVAAIVTQMLSDSVAMARAAQQVSLTAEEIDDVLAMTKQRGSVLRWVERVMLHVDQLVVRLVLPARTPVVMEQSSPYVLRRRGQERRLVILGSTTTSSADPRILKALRIGFQFWEQLQSERPLTAAQFARQHGVDNRYVGRALQLRFLSPVMIERLINGRQRPELTGEQLLRRTTVALSWDQQSE